MRKVSKEELRNLQFNLLEVFADFCNEHDIKYFLTYGTLLGAIRHKGYIPWDDDIDVGMLREDYEKFHTLFATGNTNPRYKLEDIRFNINFDRPFTRLLDLSTEATLENTTQKTNVLIDIFCYDNAPDDDDEFHKWLGIRDELRKKYYAFNRLTIKRKFNNPVLRALQPLISAISPMLLRIWNPQKYLQQIAILATKYASQDTNRVACFVGYGPFICDKSACRNVIDAEFEGKYFKVPENYDLWLKCLYGDYMTLPPVEQRIGHHHYFEVFIKD